LIRSESTPEITLFNSKGIFNTQTAHHATKKSTSGLEIPNRNSFCHQPATKGQKAKITKIKKPRHKRGFLLVELKGFEPLTF
jgi:hypothetical protein